MQTQPPTRRAYFPTASYVEMTEWVLPPDETPVFARLLDEARALRDLPAARFLRGGFWRNYLARYREINELHKQMLRVSDKVEAMPPRAGSQGARSTTSTRASRTTATGTGSSAASTSSTCEWPRSPS